MSCKFCHIYNARAQVQPHESNGLQPNNNVSLTQQCCIESFLDSLLAQHQSNPSPGNLDASLYVTDCLSATKKLVLSLPVL
jgi:hypothetical protein